MHTERIKIVYKNSHWFGTWGQIYKWATGPVYNDIMSQRAEAAYTYLLSQRNKERTKEQEEEKRFASFMAL